MTHPCPPGFRYLDDIERPSPGGLCPNASPFAERMRRVFKQYRDPWVGIWTFEAVTGPFTAFGQSYYLEPEIWDSNRKQAERQIELDAAKLRKYPADLYADAVHADVHYDRSALDFRGLPQRVVRLVPWVAKEVNRIVSRRRYDLESVAALSSHLREIADWASVERPDIMRMGAEQAIEASRQWHEALAPKGEKRSRVAGGGTTIYQWEDGWHADLLTTHAELVAEGCAMGHCVGQSDYWEEVQDGTTRIISLRDERDASRLTLELSWTDLRRSQFWTLEQVKGFANRLPRPDECVRIDQMGLDFEWQIAGMTWGTGDLRECSFDVIEAAPRVPGHMTEQGEDLFFA